MTLLEELKHSIKMHLLVMGGPTPQLCVFTMKIVDFLDDRDDVRRTNEMAQLALAIVETIAMGVHHGVVKTETAEKPLPTNLRANNDHLLILLARCRSMTDKIEAKYLILKKVASVLADFSAHQNTKYPTITDAAGNQL